MRRIRSVIISLLAVLCFGCGSAPGPHLEKNWIVAMSRGSVAIVYVDPNEQLGVLRYNQGADGNAYGGGAVGAIVASGMQAAGNNDIEKKLAAFQPIVVETDPIGHDYDTVHTTLSAIPWLKDAKWMRIRRPADLRQAKSAKELVKEADADVVFIIYPHALIYADGDPLAVRCEVSAYSASPAGSYEINRIDTRFLDAVSPLGPDGSDSLPNPMAYNQYLRKGKELDQQLQMVFADDGAVFKQAYAETQPKLQSALWFYFTDSRLPTAP
jgi:hypothetical protein